jgi:hypothetical protein
MGACNPAEAVEVLDLLLKFYGAGERWVKGRMSDRRGNRCLVGALDFVSSHHVIQSDGAERYFHRSDPGALWEHGDGSRSVFSCRSALSSLSYAIPTS